MYFASDNGGPVAPQIMDALNKANEGHAPAYGSDSLMKEVTTRIRAIFEAPDAAVYLVPTGTAANSLSLACYSQPWQSIYCHRVAHIEKDECGAPEFYTGGSKLVLIDGENGKMHSDHLREAIGGSGRGDVHNVQRGPLSITNVTETGTVYTLEEMRALTTIAKEANLPCHLDGARFANAMVALGCTPADMTWKSGFDIVSFGGTKNGCMGVEAVIIFDPEKAWEFELRRKRAGHLFSKHRYLSAQMLAYLTDDLWIDLATTANARAKSLEAGLNSSEASLVYPRGANMIFTSFSRKNHKRALDAGAIYGFYQNLDGPDEEILPSRMVCNFATREEDIDQFVKIIS